MKDTDGKMQKSVDTWAKGRLHFCQRFTTVCQEVLCFPVVNPHNSEQ